MESKNGFTIIEILIALSIIAILTTIGLANFSAGQRVTRDKIRKSDLHQIASALEIYYQKYDKYIDGTPGVEGDCTSADTAALYSLDPNIGILSYMANQVVPTDPDTKDNYCYISVESGASFRLFSMLENCSDPEIINPSTCGSDPYNYSIVSQDLQIATLAQLNPTPTSPPTATPPPGATSTPTPTPTSTIAPYKRVFLTSTTYNGDLKTAGSGVGLGTAIDGLDGADKICQHLANLQPTLVGKTFKAWLSSSTVSAVSRLGLGSPGFVDLPYKLLDGTIIANNWADLINYPNSPISISEASVSLPASGVWTNTDFNGVIYWPDTPSVTCNNWNGTSNSGYSGISNSNTLPWTRTGAYLCSNTDKRLYCFETP